MKWELHLISVACWAEENGFVVEPNGEDNCICLISNILELNRRIKDLEKKTYIALHEAGHILISRSNSNLQLVDPRLRNNTNLSSVDRMRVFLEEVEAWNRGYKLGIRLKIPINSDKWEDERNHALQKYMKWVLKENK